LAADLVRAIDAALERYPGLSWLALSFKDQAEAIDFEMARMKVENEQILDRT
jgi:hypothetical protein